VLQQLSVGDITRIIRHLNSGCECVPGSGYRIGKCTIFSGNADTSELVSELGDDGFSGRQQARALEVPMYRHCRRLGQGLLVKERNLDFPLSCAAPIQCMSGQESGGTPYTAVPCDDFTNEVVIGSVLTELHDTGTLPTVVPLRDASTCSSDRPAGRGFLLMDYFSGGELSGVGLQNPAFADWSTPSESERVLLLLAQLIFTLEFLQQEYQFIGGDMKAANVLVRIREEGAALDLPAREDHSTWHRFRLFDTPLVLGIADFATSSITFPGVSTEICNRYRYLGYRQAGLSWLPFSSLKLFRRRPVKTNFNSIPSFGQVYRIGRTVPAPLFYLRARHSVGVFYLSFDTYTLLVSMALEDMFHHYFTDDPLVSPVWEALWNPTALSQANRKLARYREHYRGRDHARRKINVPFSFLAGLDLQRDATTVLKDVLLERIIQRDLGCWID